MKPEEMKARKQAVVLVLGGEPEDMMDSDSMESEPVEGRCPKCGHTCSLKDFGAGE